MQAFDDFNGGEHDFVCFELEDELVCFKIDYFENDRYKDGSEDPSDPANCYRVLTLMHLADY